jgi:methylated-DNA-[protein]-cysteine S-methyltransferase
MMNAGTYTIPDLPVPPEKTWAGAERALRKRFASVRVSWGWVDAPFGPVFLARTTRGVCRLSFRQGEDALLSDLERRSLLPERAPAVLDRERRQLEEYFAGARRRFEVPIDLRWGSPFQRQVLEAARRIPFGSCQCYSDVAREIGRPNAQRAVGNALGSNPVAILIPCHRVVAAGGALGGYTGGVDIKKSLMKIEGITLGKEKDS